MPDNSFFDEQKYQSEVKSVIVYKFFDAWFNVLHNVVKRKPDSRLGYIDLFAGRGYYGERKVKSTPIMILERAVERPDMRQNLLTYFNDANSENSHMLEEAVTSLTDVEKLKYRPRVDGKQVGPESIAMLKRICFPYLLFADPWGYKGLSLELFRTVVPNWGTDCIFFFNFNRINMHINNPFMVQNMNSLFGELRADELRRRVEGMVPWERESHVVEAIAAALKSLGSKFVIPFPFKTDDGSKTSHHLIYTTKNRLGHDIMKSIMAKASTTSEQGVPSFECNPARQPKKRASEQGMLFEMPGPLDDLQQMLLDHFGGCQISFQDVFDEHNVGRRYTDRNYREAVLKLIEDGRILPIIPQGKRLLPGTMPGWCVLDFLKDRG